MPFERRKTQPGLPAALDTVRAVDGEVRGWEAQRRNLIEERAEAIRRAIDLGATLKDIADLLGVSVSRARQMRDGR